MDISVSWGCHLAQSIEQTGCQVIGRWFCKRESGIFRGSRMTWGGWRGHGILWWVDLRSSITYLSEGSVSQNGYSKLYSQIGETFANKITLHSAFSDSSHCAIVCDTLSAVSSLLSYDRSLMKTLSDLLGITRCLYVHSQWTTFSISSSQNDEKHYSCEYCGISVTLRKDSTVHGNFTFIVGMLKDKNYPDPSLCDTKTARYDCWWDTTLSISKWRRGAGNDRLLVERIAHLGNQFFANISSGWNFRMKSFKQKLCITC